MTWSQHTFPLYQIPKKRNIVLVQGHNNNSMIGCYGGDHNVQRSDPFYPATSLIPDLDCEIDPFSLWFVGLWEE